MVETCLWVMTRRNIFGMSLRKLTWRNIFGNSPGKLTKWGKQRKVKDRDEVEDWESLPSLPFDFHLNLPEMAMYPFVFDSKLFLAGGYIESYTIRGMYREPQPYGLSSKIYHLFEDVDKEFHITEAPADCIPPPPTAVCDSFVANIAGEVYLLVYDEIMQPRVMGFWVLRSGLWQRLPDPPSLFAMGFARSCECFVHQDKLFLQDIYMDEARLILYVFDPRTVTWTKVENSIRASFGIWDSDDYCFPEIVLSLPDVCNCRVTLTWSFEKVPGDYQVRVKISAMLVNKQDHSVFCYQSLDDCSNAIKPSSFNSFSTRVKFVDLGNGLVCALVNGHVPEHDNGLSPVLCVLVFALSLAEEPDTEALAGKEQRFLTVDGVVVNQVFTMKDYVQDYKREELLHAFIFPPKEELPPKHAYSSKEQNVVRLWYAIAEASALSPPRRCSSLTPTEALRKPSLRRILASAPSFSAIKSFDSASMATDCKAIPIRF